MYTWENIHTGLRIDCVKVRVFALIFMVGNVGFLFNVVHSSYQHTIPLTSSRLPESAEWMSVLSCVGIVLRCWGYDF